MPKRKLTDKVKAVIKASKGRVLLKDYTGEALAYLRNYRQLAKARKTKKDSLLKLTDPDTGAEIVIPKNSRAYQRIEKAADAKTIATGKKYTVARLQKEFPGAIAEYVRRGSFHMDRETDYLLEDLQDLKKNVKISVGKYGQVGKEKVIFQLKQLQNNTANYSEIFILIHKVAYSLDGMNIRLDFPFTPDYQDLLFEIDREEWGEEESDAAFTEMLEEYDTIIIVRSPKKGKNVKQ